MNDYRHPQLSPLTFNQVTLANQERLPKIIKWYEDRGMPGSGNWKTADWIMALTGELGELANLLKKRARGQEISDLDIAKEIADTFLYLDLLTSYLNLNIGQAIQMKFNEVSNKYELDTKL